MSSTRPDFQFEAAISRIPKWILGLGLAGTGLAGRLGAGHAAGGFLLGAMAAYFNFWLIERAVNRMSRLAASEPERASSTRGAALFFQFLGLISGVFVILVYSGFSLSAAFCGFLVCPAAVIAEILYELITYGHS